jgi:pimeloyl-ACP methyl ester carboxylesterase
VDDPDSGTSFTSRDGCGIWYADSAGPGEALVFLHGFSGSSAAASHFAARVSEAGLRFIAPDLRGHGFSGKPVGSDAYRPDRYVDDCAALLDQIGLERVHLVGHCMGGMVAAAFAAAQPGRVATLTLVGTSLQPGRDLRLSALAKHARSAWLRGLTRWAFPADTNTPRHVDYSVFSDTSDWNWRRLMADYRSMTGEVACAIVGHLHEMNAIEATGLIQAPALVVHGSLDSVFPLASASRTVEALPDATLLVLPDDNHVSLVFRADSALYEAVLDFVMDTRPQ